jgi:hypothetical protein
MEASDATQLARTQIYMEMESGGVMTINRMAQVAADWTDEEASHSAIMSRLWMTEGPNE